ncbi:TLC domain-containing protein 1 isoform X1 [Cyclopterus lumpus]|uniref:TLC domain-containing protein 1 isoform X1 n=1 Tax=Cyclopterus lumpus TaxID=8103 RepID=UPI001486F13C|nr:TLC domain-containing protein 1 isoform X1 [Cyclopterus lumpus]XP_034405086.1 TLC domain-containing protein 1 isoform X1 [Cyclopterus lumpus]
MDVLVPVLKSHPGKSVLVFALIFKLIHRLLQRLPVPKVVKQDDFKSWKWKNLSVSIVHSLLTGSWALTCSDSLWQPGEEWHVQTGRGTGERHTTVHVLVWPEMLRNLHSYHTPLSYLLVCVSTGYFVHDASDIILTGHGRQSWEFLLHHVLVISCFLYALFTKMYVAGAVVALFVEVNSVTLHMRLMLKLACAQSSSVYHVNKLINITTYLTFRLGTQSYLTWYIVTNYTWLDHALYFLIAMVMMNVMILIYFYRLLCADFFPWSKRSGRPNGPNNNHSKKFPCD